jgi:membrane-associated protease RseP (regulator of RpoE activity)
VSPRQYGIPLFLFILTCITTLGAGALQIGINPFDEPGRIMEGAPFALPLMLILLSHEFGHYFASRFHHVNATLPYFIPAPSIIGTFGAFIKMKSPIETRKALIDIGASGPLVGFVFSVMASIVGLVLSDIREVPQNVEGMLLLGDSLLFTSLSDIILGPVPEGSDIFLHPIAFAGWIGLFVTALNLIPIGQLDGGHVTYAFLGSDDHRKLSMLLVGLLALCGFLYWPGWAMWAFLMLVLGIKHPPVMYWEAPLDRRRRKIGFAAIIIFILTFPLNPFTVTM